MAPAGPRSSTRVTLPLAAPAVGGGLALAWARALGEFGATIMFAGNIAGRTQTLPLVVYSEFQASLDASVAAAAVLVLAAFGVLVAVRLSRWRRGLDWRGMVWGPGSRADRCLYWLGGGRLSVRPGCGASPSA